MASFSINDVTKILGNNGKALLTFTQNTWLDLLDFFLLNEWSDIVVPTSLIGHLSWKSHYCPAHQVKLQRMIIMQIEEKLRA